MSTVIDSLDEIAEAGLTLLVKASVLPRSVKKPLIDLSVDQLEALKPFIACPPCVVSCR